MGLRTFRDIVLERQGDPLRPMTKDDVDALRAEFEARGQTSVLI